MPRPPAPQTFFSQHANVLRVEIPRDRETGRQKAFAFLTAASEADAAKLVGKTFEIDGRPVDARQSKRKEETVTKSRKIFIGGTPPSTTGAVGEGHGLASRASASALPTPSDPDPACRWAPMVPP